MADAYIRLRCTKSFLSAVQRCAKLKGATISDIARWALLMYMEQAGCPYRPPLDATPPACMPRLPSDGDR